MTKPKIKIQKAPKIYNLDIEKLHRQIGDVAYIFSFLGITEEHEHFEEIKQFLIIPEEPKSLEELKQEFDKKIDAIIKTTKEKFEYSKIVSEKKYNYEFDKINERFEYAKDNGHFPPTLTIGTLSGSYLLSSDSGDLNWTSNFVIKSTPMGAGYWDIKPNIQVWLKEKPTWIVRKCTKIFFDFDWKNK